MKLNVDLTLNRTFSSDRRKTFGQRFSTMFYEVFETFQWIENGIKKEFFNSENPNAKKDFDDFINGVTLVATGSKFVRKHKLDVRGHETGEICYECGAPVRIPWQGCSCFKKYQKSHGNMKQSCRAQLNYPEIIK